MSDIYALLRDKKIFLRREKKKEIFECDFYDVKSYPNVPFYHNIYNVEHINFFERFYKDFISKFFNLIKPNLICLIPSDAQEVDEVLLKNFFLDARCFSGISFCNEALCVSNRKAYVCVSKTERMLVLSYVKNGEIDSQEFLYPDSISDDRLRDKIRKLHPDCGSIDMPIILNGEHLRQYSNVGIVLGVDYMLSSLEKVL